MVEKIHPVTGKIIELIILLSQIDVIRIRLRAPFPKDSEEGYTDHGSDSVDQICLDIPAFILFYSNPTREILFFVWNEFTS